jgi:hypothetical protein
MLNPGIFTSVVVIVIDLINPSTSWSFNVALYIDLPPFTPFQVAELVKKCGYSLSEAELTHLNEMVGGVPGLILQALKLL